MKRNVGKDYAEYMHAILKLRKFVAENAKFYYHFQKVEQTLT